jgi:L-malate glycosyltransferase
VISHPLRRSEPRDRVKILFAIVGLDVGGAEQQLTELLLRMDRQVFDPVVCCLGCRGPLADVIEAAGIRVEVIGLRRVRESGWRDGVAIVGRLWHFARLLWSERPHIVQGMLYWAYVPAAFLARATGIPIVIATRLSLGRYKDGRPILLWLERLGNRWTDVVVANAEAVRADAIRQEALPPEKVVVIHNGVDLGRFAGGDASLRRELGLPEDAVVVGVIANLLQYKGHDVFLDAWKSVLRRHPRAVALLVGDGPLRGRLEDRLRSEGLAGSVRLAGVRRDIPRVLAAVDVVAHPSYEEGSANAILEALAAAKPVVATAVGGTVEAVVHERTGLLVPPGDAAALAEGICRLIEDRHAADAFGGAGRELVRDRYDMALMVAGYERLFLDLWRREEQSRPQRAGQPHTQRLP